MCIRDEQQLVAVHRFVTEMLSERGSAEE